jgi:hypothetical protein
MIHECPDYSVRLEYNKEFVIVHLPVVNKFNRSVQMDMEYRLEDWLDFFSNLGYNGLWTAIDPSNKKIIRLLNNLNFKKQGESDGMEVYKFEGLN